MKVICPYVGDIPEQTRSALDRAAPGGWQPIDVSGDDTAYTRLLSRLWSCRQGLLVVEHDIVVRSDTIRYLMACDEAWCAFTYPYSDGLCAGLGCTKFTGEFTGRYPDAVAATWADESEQHPSGHWCQLDERLTRVLTAAGATKHLHGPPIGHLNPNPSHTCSWIPATIGTPDTR